MAGSATATYEMKALTYNLVVAQQRVHSKGGWNLHADDVGIDVQAPTAAEAAHTLAPAARDMRAGLCELELGIARAKTAVLAISCSGQAAQVQLGHLGAQAVQAPAACAHVRQDGLEPLPLGCRSAPISWDPTGWRIGCRPQRAPSKGVTCGAGRSGRPRG